MPLYRGVFQVGPSATTHGPEMAAVLACGEGAVLSHRNLIVTARNAAVFEGLREDEEILSYLPMAWIGGASPSFFASIFFATRGSRLNAATIFSPSLSLNSFCTGSP